MFISSTIAAQPYETVQGFISVYGSSNIPGWKVTSQHITCNAQLDFVDSTLVGVQSLHMSAAVKDLKGAAASMNKTVYKALKAPSFERIHFNTKSVKVTALGKGRYFLQADGSLRIAGVTKPTVVGVVAVLNSDGTINCSGSKNIRMSEFNVVLPNSLIKSMAIGDQVNVVFKMLLSRQF